MSQNTLLKTEENLPEMCREIRLFGSSLSSKHPNDIDLLFVARGGWGMNWPRN